MNNLFNFKLWKDIRGELRHRWQNDYTSPKDIVGLIQEFLMRGARGYSHKDYLEANKHIALVTKNVLRDLRANLNECPEGISEEDWDEYLTLMIQAWEKMYHFSVSSIEMNYLGQRELDVGMYLFESNFQKLKGE